MSLFGPEPMSRPLSTEAIEALYDFTPVLVKWSGGNGPWPYRIVHYGGDVLVASDEELRRGRLDVERALTGPWSFTGQEPPFTRVWLL